jgi:hypothetical protein
MPATITQRKHDSHYGYVCLPHDKLHFFYIQDGGAEDFTRQKKLQF